LGAILVLTAVELEARALARALRLPRLESFSFPVFGDARFRLAPVGLAASSLSARLPELLEGLDHPLVISAGVCGALDPGVTLGSLILPETVIGPRGERYAATVAHHRQHVAALSGHGMPFAIGALATVAEVAATPEAKAKLRESTGAVAVDMESARILRAAAEAGCPALVLRGVSDDAGDSLSPELAALITAEGRVRKARAAETVLRHPSILPKALKLQRATRRALATVAAALQRAVEYPSAVEHEPR
jgi:adenosylhomocysteine nucleosidase